MFIHAAGSHQYVTGSLLRHCVMGGRPYQGFGAGGGNSFLFLYINAPKAVCPVFQQTDTVVGAGHAEDSDVVLEPLPHLYVALCTLKRLRTRCAFGCRVRKGRRYGHGSQKLELKGGSREQQAFAGSHKTSLFGTTHDSSFDFLKHYLISAASSFLVSTRRVRTVIDRFLRKGQAQSLTA